MTTPAAIHRRPLAGVSNVGQILSILSTLAMQYPPTRFRFTDRLWSSLFQVFDLKCGQNAVLLPRWALGTSRGDLRDALGSLRGSCDVICMPQDRFRLRFRPLLTSFSMLPSTRELDSRKSYRDDFWSRKSSAKRVPGRPRRRPRGPRELPEPPWSVPGTPPEHPRRSPGAPNACNRAPVTSKRRPGTSKSSIRRPPGTHFGASGFDFASFFVCFVVFDVLSCSVLFCSLLFSFFASDRPICPQSQVSKTSLFSSVLLLRQRATDLPPIAGLQGAAVNRRRRRQLQETT